MPSPSLQIVLGFKGHDYWVYSTRGAILNDHANDPADSLTMMGKISRSASWQIHWIERKGWRSGTWALTFLVHLGACFVWLPAHHLADFS